MSLNARACRLAAVAVLCGCSLVTATGCRTAPSDAKCPTEPSRAPSRFDLPPHDFIYVGMNVERVTRLVGSPQQIAPAPNSEIWYYEFGAMVVEEGHVKYKYPPESVARRSDGLESNTGSAGTQTGD